MGHFLIVIGICLSIFIIFLVTYIINIIINFLRIDVDDFADSVGAGCFLLTLCIGGLILVISWLIIK